jgi:hypothetical protein
LQIQAFTETITLERIWIHHCVKGGPLLSLSGSDGCNPAHPIILLDLQQFVLGGRTIYRLLKTIIAKKVDRRCEIPVPLKTSLPPTLFRTAASARRNSLVGCISQSVICYDMLHVVGVSDASVTSDSLSAESISIMMRVVVF